MDSKLYLVVGVNHLNEIEPNFQKALESLGTGYEFEIEKDVLKIKYLGKELEFIIDTDKLDDLSNEISLRFKMEEIKDLVSDSENQIELVFDEDVWGLRETDEPGWGILVKC